MEKMKNRNQDFVCSETATKSKFRHIYILRKLTTIVDDFPKNIKKRYNKCCTFFINFRENPQLCWGTRKTYSYGQSNKNPTQTWYNISSLTA